MTKILLGIIVVIIVIVGGVLIMSADEEGSLYISLTDAAASLENVERIDMTIDEVEIYSETQGWISVSSDSQTYDLLALRDSGESKLVTQSDIKADEYSRIRLSIDSVLVKESNGTTAQAHLPSEKMELASSVTVAVDQVSSINLDVLADQSLHTTTGGGAYVFAPVVKVETRSNAEVSVDSNDTVSISGGSIDSQTTIGMDIKGNTAANFALNSGAELMIESNGSIQLSGGNESQAIINIGGSSLDGSLNGAVNGGLNGDVNLGGGTGGSATSSNSLEGNLEGTIESGAGLY